MLELPGYIPSITDSLENLFCKKNGTIKELFIPREFMFSSESLYKNNLYLFVRRLVEENSSEEMTMVSRFHNLKRSITEGNLHPFFYTETIFISCSIE